MKQKVFITRYAFTKGVIQAELELKVNYWIGYIEDYQLPIVFYKNEVFLTESEALKDCELKRIKKLDSLKNQIAKIEKIKFKVK